MVFYLSQDFYFPKMCDNFKNTLQMLIYLNKNIEQHLEKTWEPYLEFIYMAYDAFREAYLSADVMRTQILPFAFSENYQWSPLSIIKLSESRGRITSEIQLWLLIAVYLRFKNINLHLENDMKLDIPHLIYEDDFLMVKQDLSKILLYNQESKAEMEKKLDKAVDYIKNIWKNK